MKMIQPWKLFRNGKPESSVICQYVCQSVLFVQPIKSLTQGVPVCFIYADYNFLYM